MSDARGRQHTVLMAIIAFVALTPRPAWPVNYEGPQFDYYEVSGDVRAVSRQMKERGPDGGYSARTDHKINAHFTTHPSPEGCRVESVVVDLHVVIKLPWLIAGNGETQQRWRDFEPALRVHEMGHAALALSAANEIEKALLNIPAQESCSSAESLAKEVTEKLLAKLRGNNQLYDLRTNHGITQGAKFL